MLSQILLAASVAITTPTDNRYECIDPEGVIVAGAGSDSIVTTRNACVAASEERPGEIYQLTLTELITSSEPPVLEWVVHNGPGTDKPLYECDAACLADRVRGPRIGDERSYPELLGRTEGPLDPPWISGRYQWQFHTNANGVRGLV